MTAERGTKSVPASAPRHVYGPRAVAAVLPAVTRPALRKHGPALGALAADWPSVVGPALAELTQPVRLAQGTLTLACAGPVALELQHLAPQILERINLHLGRGAAQRLRIVQRTLAPPTPEPPAPARPPAKAASAAEAAVADLPEGPLRDALRQLGEAVLSRTLSSTRRGSAA